MKISLRELKKAKAKIALFEASLALIGQHTFREVKLEDICARAELSKVTFFKFFPQKEDVLVYFMKVWLLERMLEIEEGGLKGRKALWHILRCVAETSDEKPGLMLSLIGFLSETRMHPWMPDLNDAELHLLFPGKEERAKGMNVDLFALFRRLVNEALETGECVRKESPEEISQWLTTIFYGGYLTSHLCGIPVEDAYESHLRFIFR